MLVDMPGLPTASASRSEGQTNDAQRGIAMNWQKSRRRFDANQMLKRGRPGKPGRRFLRLVERRSPGRAAPKVLRANLNSCRVLELAEGPG